MGVISVHTDDNIILVALLRRPLKAVPNRLPEPPIDPVIQNNYWHALSILTDDFLGSVMATVVDEKNTVVEYIWLMPGPTRAA